MSLEPFGEEIWLADGPEVSFYGFPYPTRMAVARLPDRTLWVWSPIALSDALRRELEALGPVRHLVTPNKIHHLFLGEWQAAWPDARTCAPPGLAARRRDLRFDAELGDGADPAWGGAIESLVIRGSLVMDEVWFLHRPSRTCLVGDLVQRHDPAGMTGWRGALMRLDGLVGPRGGAPREWRATFWNRRAARKGVRAALAWKPDCLVVAHGACAAERGAEVLADAMRWLRP